MGVMSALPIINALNVCCCLWVVTGGLVAAYLLQQSQSTPISAGDGALVGLYAGFLGAVVSFALSIPIGILIGPMQREMLQRAVERSGNDLPPGLREFLQSVGEPRSDVSFAVRVIASTFGFIVLAIVGSIFSTLGGLLGAAIFKKKPPMTPPSLEPPQTFDDQPPFSPST